MPGDIADVWSALAGGKLLNLKAPKAIRMRSHFLCTFEAVFGVSAFTRPT